MATTAEIIARLVDLFTLNTTTDTVSPNHALGPNFSAYLAADLTLTASTFTVMPLATKSWDTDNAYSTTTYQFNPKKAGKYMVTVNAFLQAATGQVLTNALVFISKNGSASTNSVGQANVFSSNQNSFANVTKTIQMNGTTDYICAVCYAAPNAGAPVLKASDAYTWFEAVYVGP